MFNDLITVCYPPGSCGNAIAYLLALSPEVWQDWRWDRAYADPIDQNGAVHCIPSRLGTMDPERGETSIRDIIQVCKSFGYDYQPGAGIPHDVERYFRDTRMQTVGFGPPALLARLPHGHKTIHAAHATGDDMRRLYPGTRVVTVHGDVHAMIRNFADKFALLPDPDESELGCHIDAELKRNGNTPSRATRKHWLGSAIRKLASMNDINTGDRLSHSVDFSMLLDERHGIDVYHGMVEFCGMTPNWEEASGFLSRYRQMQRGRTSR